MTHEQWEVLFCNIVNVAIGSFAGITVYAVFGTPNLAIMVAAFFGGRVDKIELQRRR